MIVLAFSDVHGHKPSMEKLRKKSRKADVIISAGDLSIFGRSLDKEMAFVASFGKPALMLHGNHETAEEMQALVSEPIYFLHGHHVVIRHALFVGWGGGGFSTTDDAFEKHLKEFLVQCSKYKKVIFVTHQPPYGTRLDWVYGHHTGNKSYRDFIVRAQPTLAISGHIHETAGMTDVIGKTLCINPGSSGVLLDI